MERSWLVQRLRKPQGSTNPFAFGGGLKNGGLRDEAMEMLRGIFSFDYMGAAEFEFGELPKALSRIAKDVKHYRTATMTVPLAEVPKDWRDKDEEEPEGEATIYVIAHKAHLDEATDRIDVWARSHTNDLKEQPRLSSALRPYREWDRDICGWLELNNGFFFFTNEEMFLKTADLFGIETLERT